MSMNPNRCFRRTMTPACVVLWLLAATPAVANTVHVDGSGSCAGLTPCFTTFATAVAAATSPAEILIFPGTYDEELNLDVIGVGTTVTVVTVNDDGDPEQGTATITNTGGQGVTGEQARAITIDGLAANGNDGAGFRFDVSESLVMVGVEAIGNDADGVYVESDDGSTIDIRDAVFNRNDE